MKVRKSEYLLLVALASSAAALQLREHVLPTATAAPQQAGVSCSEPTRARAATGRLLEAACRGDRNPRQVQGTLHRLGKAPRHLQMQV